MKNNNIISLNQWKKCNQTNDTSEALNTKPPKGKFIIPTEIDEKFNIELEEIFLSGMVIW